MPRWFSWLPHLRRSKSSTPPEPPAASPGSRQQGDRVQGELPDRSPRTESHGDPDMAFADPSIQHLVARVSREKERLAALLTVSHAVVNSLDLDTILSTIAQQVRQVIDRKSVV